MKMSCFGNYMKSGMNYIKYYVTRRLNISMPKLSKNIMNGKKRQIPSPLCQNLLSVFPASDAELFIIHFPKRNAP